jgi:hypothetical protein
VLQLPQWFSSLSRSKHFPPHSVKPLLQRHSPFLPPLHLAWSQQSLFLSHFLPTFLQAAATGGVSPTSSDEAAPVSNANTPRRGSRDSSWRVSASNDGHPCVRLLSAGRANTGGADGRDVLLARDALGRQMLWMRPNRQSKNS